MYSPNKMGNLLVTGGCGFIGSHTCLLLLKKGYKLVILDSLINSYRASLERVSQIVFGKPNNERINFIKGDIRDKKLLDDIFNEAKLKNQNFDGVIHFAGLKSIVESINKPFKSYGRKSL